MDFDCLVIAVGPEPAVDEVPDTGLHSRTGAWDNIIIWYGGF